jgi:hypothetical protein
MLILLYLIIVNFLDLGEETYDDVVKGDAGM